MKHKRRRESGLLLPQLRSATPEAPDQGEKREGSETPERPSTEDTDTLVRGEITAKRKSKKQAIGSIKMKDIAAQLRSIDGDSGQTKRQNNRLDPGAEFRSPGGLSPVGEEDDLNSELVLQMSGC